MEYRNTKTPLEEIEYWLFSNEDRAVFARARQDIPLDLINGVTEEDLYRHSENAGEWDVLRNICQYIGAFQ